MKAILSSLFDEIIREVENNPRFRQRLEDSLRGHTVSDATPDQRHFPSRRNRRQPGVLDPYQDFAKGEDYIRSRLAKLTVEQLKDIVSEHALDSSRLALKWKSADRLIDLIVTTVRSRLEKGDAFRD